MPKETFFKLDEEKRNKIIEGSVKEFAKANFKEVKVSSIINAAGIPRSSFYDYFIDKMDLYRYILELIGKKKQTYLKESHLEHGDFFSQLHGIISIGATFMAFEPEYDLIGKNLLSDPNLVREVYGEDSLDVSSVLEDMLLKGIEAGDVKGDIDVEFIAKTLNILASQLMVEGSKNEAYTMEEVIEQIAVKLTAFIKYGISTK